MKTKIVSGAAIAATAVALVLTGAVKASAEDKPKTADKPQTEKMACGAKAGCGAEAMAKAKAKGESGDKAAVPGEHKSGGAK